MSNVINVIMLPMFTQDYMLTKDLTLEISEHNKVKGIILYRGDLN